MKWTTCFFLFLPLLSWAQAHRQIEITTVTLEKGKPVTDTLLHLVESYQPSGIISKSELYGATVLRDADDVEEDEIYPYVKRAYYNKKGQVIKEVMQSESALLNYTAIFMYDTQGNLMEERKESQGERRIYTFKNEYTNNQLKRTTTYEKVLLIERLPNGQEETKIVEDTQKIGYSVFEYNKENKIKQETQYDNSDTKISEISYTYTAAGKIKEKKEKLYLQAPATVYRWAYTYDNQQRVTHLREYEAGKMVTHSESIYENTHLIREEVRFEDGTEQHFLYFYSHE